MVNQDHQGCHESDDTDPLDGADVGETRTVREEVELHTIDFEPDVFWGSDRIGTSEIESVEVVEDENCDEKLAVTFEGELTKALPRRWDSYREPLTDAEEKDERRKRLIVRALNAGAVLVPMAIATFLAMQMMNAMTGMTINGEAVQPPRIELFLAIFAFMAIFAWALQWLPGRVGGRLA